MVQSLQICDRDDTYPDNLEGVLGMLQSQVRCL